MMLVSPLQSITSSKKKDGRKSIVVLTCCDDPIGRAPGGGSKVERLRKERLQGILKKCQDLRAFNIEMDVYPLQVSQKEPSCSRLRYP